ncbi:MAG: tetratricopeptide repeat protein [Suilimivivens sp.]
MEEQENYGYEGNLYEQLEAELCHRCHRGKIDRSENPESVLCKDCREELIRLKVPPVMIGVGILVLVMVFLCVGMFAVDFIRIRTGSESRGLEKEDALIQEASTEDLYEDTSDKQRRLDFWATGTDELSQSYVDLADTGMVVTALDSMLDELEADPENLNMAIALADVAMKYSYPDYAAYAIDNYLAGKDVSDEAYERIIEYIDKLDVYYDTYDMIDEAWNTLGEGIEALGEEASDQDYVLLVQACHDEIAEHLGDENYDQALINYDLAYICQDEDERIEHLRECVGYDENYFDAQAQLGTYYRRAGELDEARTILEAAYDVNREAYPVLRSLATLELCEGNLELGLAYAEYAYNLYAEGDYVIDTYLVALAANGEREKAESLIREWEDKGYVFDDDFYAFQMGDMTLEEYYIGD